MKKPLYIIKIGGSVVTYKNKKGVVIRKKLIKKIGQTIKKAQEEKSFDLVLIHGAGSAGHQLAHQYKLSQGTKGNHHKRYGALISRTANCQLNTAISEIFIQAGLAITPVHTASVVVQKNKALYAFDLATIKIALKQKYIPLLYGEMVFDEKLDMSICSGDTIAPFLAKKLKAKKLFFASDIDGVFTQDPHKNKKAVLLEKIEMKKIEQSAHLAGSHNVDVTKGLLGKIEKIKKGLEHSNIKTVEIFNGLKYENYKKILLEKTFQHTRIKLK